MRNNKTLEKELRDLDLRMHKSVVKEANRINIIRNNLERKDDTNYIEIPIFKIPFLGTFIEEEYIYIVNKIYLSGLMSLSFGVLTMNTNIIQGLPLNTVSFLLFTCGGLMFFGTMHNDYLNSRRRQ